MEYRELGKTGLEVSAITFGAWAIGGWMWGGTDAKAAVAAIRAGIDEGMSSIDTAPIYGYGLSERLVGEALKGLPRDKVQVLTKFGMRWDTTQGSLHMTDETANPPLEIRKYAGRDSVIAECEESLRRLGTDYIDLYQIHWPDVTTPIAETMEAVLRLKEQGKIREAGVCNYSAAQLAEAGQVIPLASNQVPYSMVLRDIEKEVVPYCLDHGLGILAYSPLQRGLLTGKFAPGHTFAEGDHRPGTRFYKPENMRRINSFLDELRPMAEGLGVTLAQLVLRWTIDQPGITVALAGARRPEQAVENAHAADIRIAPDDLEKIRTALAALQLEG